MILEINTVDPEHRIFDVTGSTWPGKDYYNPVFAQFEQLQDPFSDALNRAKHPRYSYIFSLPISIYLIFSRMGWHDVHFHVKGEPARDIA